MRLIYLAITLVFLHFFSFLSAQDNWIRKSNELISQEEIKNHIYFLASDGMRGRNLGSSEIENAARYIALQFKNAGLTSPSGVDNYFQIIGLKKMIFPQIATLIIDTARLRYKDQFILLNGKDTTITASSVYANYGIEEDFNHLEVKNKFIIVRAGDDKSSGFIEYYNFIKLKEDLAIQHGAAGIIELVPKGKYPWWIISANQSSEKIILKNESDPDFCYLWVDDSKSIFTEGFMKKPNAKITIKIKGLQNENVPAWNIVGFYEGSDSVLKNEYIVVSAHYDHVGVGRPVQGDSIYNGARDNAIGITCLILSAEFLKKVGSKRSILFLACTGEEKGLLGSSWYADNPVIPLKETIFDLNTDGAGYNDTSLLTVIDLKRTTIDSLVIKAAGYNGLKVNGDPVPEQMLYDRSDNVSFAKNGVPSVNLSPGLTAFDAEIMKYYHNPKDEPGNLDYNYVTKYIKSFVITLKLLTDSKERPFWLKGDVYEKAGLSLYGSRP